MTSWQKVLLISACFFASMHLSETVSIWGMLLGETENTTQVNVKKGDNATSTNCSLADQLCSTLKQEPTTVTEEATTEEVAPETTTMNTMEPLALPSLENIPNCRVSGNSTDGSSDNSTIVPCPPRTNESKNSSENAERPKRETIFKKYGEACESNEDCSYENAACDAKQKVCTCRPKYPATNRLDKCDIGKRVGEDCNFDEQCEQVTVNTFCDGGSCRCRGKGAQAIHSDDGSIHCKGIMFGGKCNTSEECGFKWATCEPNKGTCQCHPEYIATNHFDKCGKPAKVGEACTFHEQCEHMLYHTFCQNGKCACRSEGELKVQADGTYKCVGGSAS